MKKSTRNLVNPLRVQASMVKKSAATITARCRDKNSFQVVFRSRTGDGSRPCCFRIMGDGAVSNCMAQVGQCSWDSSVAPIPILRGHADHQPLDLVPGAGTARASLLAAVIFPGRSACGA